MVLLVIGMPFLVLLTALALERLERRLLPPPDAGPSDRADRPVGPDLHPPRVTPVVSFPP